MTAEAVAVAEGVVVVQYIPSVAASALVPFHPSLSPSKAACSISPVKSSNMRAPRLFLAKAMNPTQSGALDYLDLSVEGCNALRM